MHRPKKHCLCCKKQLLHQFSVCLQCVCCVPDCENVGLFHSLCFKHWILQSQTPQTPNQCDWTCWSCKQIPQHVLSRNYEEFMYIYKRAFKP